MSPHALRSPRLHHYVLRGIRQGLVHYVLRSVRQGIVHRVIRGCRGIWVGSSLALVAHAHHVDAGALARTAQALALRPDDAALLQRRAELLEAAGRAAEARTDIERAIESAPLEAPAYLVLARLCRATGEHELAAQACAVHLEFAPDSAAGWKLAARLAVSAGQPEQAVASFDRALQLEPSDPDLWLERARVTAGLPNGGIERALSGLDAARGQLGALVALESYAVELELVLGRPDVALERWARVEPPGPRNETWLARRAELLEAAGRTTEAHSAYRTALARCVGLPLRLRANAATSALERRLRESVARLAGASEFRR